MADLKSRKDRLLKTGLIGAGVTAVCCFTPVLVIALGAVGVASAAAWLDYLLLPMLVVFLGITGYALWLKQRG
ncbi:MAG: mercury resistance system transport protein MerF [Rhodovibrionaceae bacterium]|nr:mercury resistance system transport protein MerF [Rhodovibrionaceae bacterium]